MCSIPRCTQINTLANIIIVNISCDFGVILKILANRLSTKQNSHFNVLKFNVGASVVNLKVNYQIAQTKMINEALLLCKFDTS